jgi:exopolyphosphatase/guanosine-5'-triphosphate,3'-diphosphate pyrophosphatase
LPPLKLAAIDIGSNSIKLVVVDALSSESFTVVTREKETVRLGHNTLRDGHLAPDAIDRAADCIRRFRLLAEARGAEKVVAIATASVREADNAKEFLSTVKRIAGVRVELLSGVEEARLIGVAVAQACAAYGSSLLNIDIGGGSTELSLVQDGVPTSLFSMKLGAVGLTEQFLLSDPPKPKELRALRSQVRNALERPARELEGSEWQQATGTSGTILALGQALRSFDSRVGGRRSSGSTGAGTEIVLTQLERFNHRVAFLDVAERCGLPGISAQRAEIVIAGGQILEGVMRGLGIHTLRTCDWALREGVLIDRLREMESESRPPQPDDADPRLRGVHAVGQRFGYEKDHALHVAMLAEKILDGLAPSFGFTRHERTLLAAAALLHDAGYHIAHDSHHKHTLYLVKHSEMTGFSEDERALIANIARYHRGSLPKERHPDYAALDPEARDLVCCLAAILRVADALDRRHDGRVEDLRCIQDGQTLQLRLSSAATCDQEILAATQRGDLFEQVFRCRLAFTTTRSRATSAANAVRRRVAPAGRRVGR